MKTLSYIGALAWIVAGIVGYTPSPAHARELRTVRVETGMLEGVEDANGVTAFKGIPFAAPPVGNLRWRPPQPPVRWDGVRKADRFGASCVQKEVAELGPYTEESLTQGAVSEDCLFINVWTPAKSANERRPVMVMIYGGGFVIGSSSVRIEDGAPLANKGIVYVSMNYRVGALGFLAHPELTKESVHHSSGNYGLLDQLAALEWVHKNITAFGGDPNRVTIEGGSAGGISVALLMESRLAKGLFARAIAASGPGLIPDSALEPWGLADHEQAGVGYAKSKGVDSIAKLRAMPAADFAVSSRDPGLFVPLVDGWLVPRPSEKPANEVPLMVGFVADDLGVASALGPPPKLSVAAYQENARKNYGENADLYLRLYPAASEAEVSAMQKASGRDRSRLQLEWWAAEQATRSKSLYTYYFDRAIPWPAHPEFGVFHGSDWVYESGNLRLMDRPWQPVDYKVSDEVMSYWVNFVATGNPNGSGLPRWPAFNEVSHVTMELGAHTGAVAVADPAKRKFFEALVKRSSASR